MIELRWIWGPACSCAKHNSAAGRPVCGCSRCGQMERVLQYRTAPETFEKDDGAICRTYVPVWSDWRDVPTVTAESTMTVTGGEDPSTKQL